MTAMRTARSLCILLVAAAAPAWVDGGTTITASENAWVKSGAGDQSETNSLTVNGTSDLAYLRFDISGLSLETNDLVYLDLYFACHPTVDSRQLIVAALNDGTSGETTWDSSLTYATRPDGTGSIPNSNTTAVVTYNGRVKQQTAGSGGPRNQENPPGQIAIVISNSVLQALLDDDTNDELTLILYGCNALSTVASIDSEHLRPQLRIVWEKRAEIIPESIHGGQYQWISGAGWYDTVTDSHVGKPSPTGRACQFLLFELPKRPKGGFSAEHTSLEMVLKTDDIGGWGAAMVDIWAIGYVPAGSVPLVQNDVDDYGLMADSETAAGLNIGTDLTEKIYNNLTSSYSDPGRYGLPPDACTSLTAFVNDLFENHNAGEGDCLVLRAVADAEPDPARSYQFYTGNATNNLKPVLTLSRIARGPRFFFK